jgi:hypothetical protein
MKEVVGMLKHIQEAWQRKKDARFAEKKLEEKIEYLRAEMNRIQNEIQNDSLSLRCNTKKQVKKKRERLARFHIG